MFIIIQSVKQKLIYKVINMVTAARYLPSFKKKKKFLKVTDINN